MRQTSLELDTVRHCRQPKNTSARREEMTSVVVCVEANEITIQNTQ